MQCIITEHLGEQSSKPYVHASGALVRESSYRVRCNDGRVMHVPRG